MAANGAARHHDIQPGRPRLDPERFTSANRRKLSGPGLRTFVAISDLWGLSEEQRLRVLGFLPRSTYHGWLKAAREQTEFTLAADVLMRISAVLGIHQALGVLNGNVAEAVAWLKTPHRGLPFGGLVPLDIVVGGTQDGILVVRRFLDAARGGLYMQPNSVDEGFRPYADADIEFA